MERKKIKVVLRCIREPGDEPLLDDEALMHVACNFLNSRESHKNKKETNRTSLAGQFAVFKEKDNVSTPRAYV